MIITRLIGGLGNQMFQYAAGRALALANSCQLKLDISTFDYYALRRYELNLLNINAEIANPEDIALLAGSQFRLARVVRRKLKWRKKTHFVERKDFSFDPVFLSLTQPAYLDGYWQSYKYHECYAVQIRDELTFNTPLSGKNLKVAEQIVRTNSVSVHIRRGDYVSNPGTARIHGSVGVNYYDDAIRRICHEVTAPVFFVFSDDLTWAQNNLRLRNNATFVSHNCGKSSFEDMRLMSLCKHNIIANSSFSWWGAWLNRNPEKMVIAPKRWLNIESLSTTDLIPNTWTRC